MVEFDRESTGHGPGHVTHLLALLLANERLKILTSLLVDLQTSVRGKNGVEFCQESTRPLGPLIGRDSQWLRMTQDDSRISQNEGDR